MRKLKVIKMATCCGHQKSDIFAAGIILLELVLGIKLWKNKKSARQLIQLKLPNFSNLAEAIVAQLGLSSHFQAIDSKLLKIITRATRVGFKMILKWFRFNQKFLRSNWVKRQNPIANQKDIFNLRIFNNLLAVQK